MEGKVREKKKGNQKNKVRVAMGVDREKSEMK
jgi:hypothetical protein